MATNVGRPGFDEALERFHHLMLTEGSPERRTAMEWVEHETARVLGAGWFDSAMASPDLFQQVFSTPVHRVALFGTLDRTIRLVEHQGDEGFARLRHQVVHDLRPSSITHAEVALEVASTWHAATGLAPRFEVGPKRNPVDVVLGRGPREVPVEVFAVYADKAFRSLDDGTTELSDLIRLVGREAGVTIHADAQALPPDLVDFATALRSAAASLGPDANAALRIDNVDLQLEASDDWAPGSFTGPELNTNYLERLSRRIADKAEKTYTHRPIWLRVEVLNGLWMFPDWARWTLAEKGTSLQQAIRDAAGELDIAGLVLSPGVGVASSGSVEHETVELPEGGFGLRRRLPGLRYREALVLPMSDRWTIEAERWLEAFDSEQSWLDEALASRGLPTADRLF